MDLTKFLASAGGTASIERLAARFGLSSDDARNVVGAVAPALKDGIQRQASSPATLDSLKRALENGNHERYLDNPDLLEQEETREDGNRILGHLLGSKQVSRDVAARAAGQTGIDSNVIKQALPLIASLAMGAMGRETRAQGGSSSGGALAALTGLLGDRKGGLGDVLSLARKLF